MNRLIVHCRSLARRAGLTRPLARLLEAMAPAGARNEHGLARALRTAIRPGDVVWDVGANVGVYTRLALERVGEHGAVVAFEPAPECFRALSQAFCGDARVHPVQRALGASPGTAAMYIEAQGVATTHRIVAAPAAGRRRGAGVREVALDSGDRVLAAGGRCPAVVKIDVEGHEEQVLQGMRDLLRRAELRHVFVEVHFALLEQAGARMAPVRIERALTDSGFVTRWLSRSHLHGWRPGGAGS